MRFALVFLSTALVVTACASGISKLVPGGPRPAWTELKADPDHPKTDFVLGVAQANPPSGAGPEFVAQVDAAARAELAKTLRVDVKSAVESLESSVSVNGVTQSSQVVEARTSEVVDLQLSGVEIAGRWFDEQSGAVFALAVLNRQEAAKKVRAQAQEKITAADDAAAKGDAALAAGDASTAVRLYLKGRSEATSSLSLSAMLRALTGEKLEVKGAAAFDAKVSSAVNGFSLSAAEGDAQRVVPGARLGRPLVAQLSFKDAAGAAHPVAGLAVQFQIGAIKAAATTGPDGKASVSPTEAVAFETPELLATAQIDWTALGANPAGLPALQTSFHLVKKGLSNTRVIVKILESIEEGAPVTASVVESALVQELTKAGFEVKDPKALVDAAGGEQALGAMNDADLKLKARGLADVLVIGTATSKFHKKFAGQVVYHRARGLVRAVDLDEGKVLGSSDLDLPCNTYGQGPDKAGAVALKGLAEKLAPQVSDKVRQALGF